MTHPGYIPKALRKLRLTRGIARLRRLSKGRKRDDDDDDRFEMPKPTYAFGAIGPFDPPSVPSPGPTRAEIEDRQLVREAMAIVDPWADTESPPLYSRRAADEDQEAS